MLVLQLHPDGNNGMLPTDPEWLGEGLGLVTWAMPWAEFLKAHVQDKYSYRPSEQHEINMRKTLMRTSLQAECDVGELGIVLLVDITQSMQDAINTVTRKLKSELLTELQARYGKHNSSYT